MCVLSRCLLQDKISEQANGPKKGGGLQIDSLKKGAWRRSQHVCVCVEERMWAHGHLYVYVCVVKVYSCRLCSDGNWKMLYCHSTPCYLLASREVLDVCSAGHSFLCEHTLTQAHKVHISTFLHCLPPTWLSPSITPSPHPALLSAGEHLQLRPWPCFKASLCSLDTNTLHCFLIICLHHRMLF